MPSRSLRRIIIAFALNASLGLLVSRGRAAPNDLQLRAARQEFARAEQDEDAGRWQGALDRLRHVAEVKHTAGVQYHIALCQEHLGQLVAALAAYTAAATQAQAESAQDVLRLVGKRLAELDPRVPRLTIHVVPQVPDATMTLDGAEVSPALIGTSMPVDPGPHRIETRAPDHLASSVEVMMHERDATVLDAKLSPATPPGIAAAPVPDPFPPARSSRTAVDRAGVLAYAITALALTGGGVGAYVAAGNSRGGAVSGCAQIASLAADACDAQKQAVRAWDWAAAGAWAGAATASVFAVLSWATPSRAASSAATLRVVVGPASLGVGGAF